MCRGGRRTPQRQQIVRRSGASCRSTERWKVAKVLITHYTNTLAYDLLVGYGRERRESDGEEQNSEEEDTL